MILQLAAKAVTAGNPAVGLDELWLVDGASSHR